MLYSLFVFFERKRAFRMLDGAFDSDFGFGRVGCCGMLTSASRWRQFVELMKDGRYVRRVLTDPYIGQDFVRRGRVAESTRQVWEC